MTTTPYISRRRSRAGGAQATISADTIACKIADAEARRAEYGGPFIRDLCSRHGADFDVLFGGRAGGPYAVRLRHWVMSEAVRLQRSKGIARGAVVLAARMTGRTHAMVLYAMRRARPTAGGLPDRCYVECCAAAGVDEFAFERVCTGGRLNRAPKNLARRARLYSLMRAWRGPNGEALSSTEIAARCGVSHQTVLAGAAAWKGGVA